MRIRYTLPTALATLAIAAAAATAQPRKTDFVLYRDGVVHGALLSKGEYKIEIAPTLDSVTFYRGGASVLSTPCKVGALAEPPTGDSVFYVARGDGKEGITRILLVRPKLSIDFGE